MKSLLLLLILIACVKIPTRELERYETMDQLWEKKAKKTDVIKVFGLPSEEVEQDIVYRPKQFPASIVSAHFFDSNGIIEEQFFLVHAEELQKIKMHLKCEWKIQEKMISTSHTVRTIENGTCASKNISYDFLPTSGIYEFRWKR